MIRKRVLIVDDYPVVRDGLVSCIESTDYFSVCGTAATAAEALGAVKDLKPDLAVIDLSLPDRHGLELIRDLDGSVRMLVLSMHEERDYAERALNRGAHGYIMKGEPTDKVLSAMREVAEGRRYLSEAMTQRMLEIATRRGGRSSTERLTDRELEVFERIGNGMTTAQIAEELGLATKTIETYRENIKAKLELQNATELVRAGVLWVEGLQRDRNVPPGGAPTA
ncbi:MAG: response regulator transcription factor [Candidatus Eisenbacteria bacterium]|uniref:Response regulator transcription factor n=1 Tax=Eiseniibacteriota bacterium TaxID=2212470 RepID=A0A956M020_UNCEI|nr:response regulator transcription factor [Candidatus Eisenbacteria bacterium]